MVGTRMRNHASITTISRPKTRYPTNTCAIGRVVDSDLRAATVRRMSQLGANILLTGRQREQAERILRQTKHNPGHAVFIPADLSVPEQVKKIVPAAISTFGRIDFAFNNAGTSGPRRLLAEQSEDVFDRVFAVNVKAVFLLLESELRFTREIFVPC